MVVASIPLLSSDGTGAMSRKTIDNPNARRPSLPTTEEEDRTVTLPGVLVGIPIGIVLLILIFFFRAYYKRCFLRTSRDGYKEHDNIVDPSQVSVRAIPVTPEPAQPIRPLSRRQVFVDDEPRLSVSLDWRELETYRLDISHVKRSRQLATGGFGSVWLGMYLGEPVAIKVMAEGRLRLAPVVQKFIDEVKIMAKLDHANIVRFIGACWYSLDAVNLVVEYMDLGDLKDHLDLHPPSSFPWASKIQCGMDVLKALIYLHNQNIVHRDIKSRNVLLDTGKPCKLSDFGISREVVSQTMSHEVGTFLWAAPEVLKGGKLTVAADIYSFGILLSELDTHQVPFDGLLTDFGDVMAPMAIVMKVMQNQIKVAPTPTCPASVVALMERCTQYEAKLRPTAIQVLETLRSIHCELAAEKIV
ncbi:hypothetical protein LEN26_007542 [Aphanomyces euteiches]|nr:hypothetical protein AeMF1_003712 [Aphanomyces euteiches]KAH9131959.1 hypothetical protein LEN26_007542 [Aphanomyces euteiches]KAH9194332.1 hypothetical protein AeNC1_003688 [Aphanomyces euteiches]